MQEQMQALLGANWVWWVLLIAIIMALFGVWPKVWALVKSAVGAVGGTVNPTLDSQVNAWLTSAKSTKVQAMLRLCESEFEAQSDADAVKAIDGLIAKAAGWKEPLK